jgi:hypothetical protein
LARENADWTIVGLRYFNVYGPREAHKGVPASMIYHLSQQMRAGQRPRIFKHGEQRRDFVYVKDVVEGTIRALDASASGITAVWIGRVSTKPRSRMPSSSRESRLSVVNGTGVVSQGVGSSTGAPCATGFGAKCAFFGPPRRGLPPLLPRRGPLCECRLSVVLEFKPVCS